MTSHTVLSLPAYGRGFHLITRELMERLPDLPSEGILHLFIQHTSAGLTLNENADPTVRVDFESFFNQMVKENEPFVVHDIEGPDDMPAHVKSSLVGSSVSIPIHHHRLMLGTWQGIYLCEFRDAPHRRKIIATIIS